VDEMGGTCREHVINEKLKKNLVSKLDLKRPLRQDCHRGINNIIKDIVEIRCEIVNWIHVVQERGKCGVLVESAMNLHGHKVFAIS
jgi:hypothetical protein